MTEHENRSCKEYFKFGEHEEKEFYQSRFSKNATGINPTIQIVLKLFEMIVTAVFVSCIIAFPIHHPRDLMFKQLSDGRQSKHMLTRTSFNKSKLHNNNHGFQISYDNITFSCDRTSGNLRIFKIRDSLKYFRYEDFVAPVTTEESQANEANSDLNNDEGQGEDIGSSAFMGSTSSDDVVSSDQIAPPGDLLQECHPKHFHEDISKSEVDIGRKICKSNPIDAVDHCKKKHHHKTKYFIEVIDSKESLDFEKLKKAGNQMIFIGFFQFVYYLITFFYFVYRKRCLKNTEDPSTKDGEGNDDTNLGHQDFQKPAEQNSEKVDQSNKNKKFRQFLKIMSGVHQALFSLVICSNTEVLAGYYENILSDTYIALSYIFQILEICLTSFKFEYLSFVFILAFFAIWICGNVIVSTAYKTFYKGIGCVTSSIKIDLCNHPARSAFLFILLILIVVSFNAMILFLCACCNRRAKKKEESLTKEVTPTLTLFYQFA